jgi:hypothetical protein
MFFFFLENDVSMNSECVLNFGVKLGKTFTETLEMLKQAFDNESIGHKHTTDTNGSRMAEFQLRTIRVLDDPQYRQTTNMSLKFVRSSVPVGVRQSGKWQRRV